MSNLKLYSKYILCICLSLCCAIGVTAEDFSIIDISSVANMGFIDKVANDKQGGWPDQGEENDLRALKGGTRKYNGVPFKIIDSYSNNNSCIALRGKYRPYLPLETTNIGVDKKGDVIVFLGACAWSASVGEDVLRMIVEYESDSAYCDTAFRFGEHIGGWWNPAPLPLADIAWEGDNDSASIGLYSFTWINPYPEETIKSIRLISSDSEAAPMIAAITLVRKSDASQQVLNNLKSFKKTRRISGSETSNISITMDFSKTIRKIPPMAISLSNGINTNNAYMPQGIKLAKAGNCRSFFRIQTHPAEPAISPGVYDFTKLDKQLDYIDALGFIPLISISKGPYWIRKKGVSGEKLKRWIPDDEGIYEQYCIDVIKHFSAREKSVLWYELGNEPDLKAWGVSLYVRLFKAVSAKVNLLDSNIKLGGPVTCGPNIGWAKLLMKEVGTNVGFVSYHQYGYSTPFNTPDKNIISRLGLYESSARKYKNMLLEQKINCPVMLTEVNTSWRFPETDPRIKTSFGAAWTATAIGNYLKGGGDIFCFFTYNGGFGMTRELKEGVYIYPVYHLYWLMRKFFHGDMILAKYNATGVNAYGYINKDEAGLFIINLENKVLNIDLDITNSLLGAKKAETYILNNKTWNNIKLVNTDGTVPQLSPVYKNASDIYNNKFNIQPYEVRLIRVFR